MAHDVPVQVHRLFPSERNPCSTRVGLEHELIARDGVSGGAVAPARVRRALHGLGVAARTGSEPGGQVELVLPPQPDVPALVAALRDDLAVLRAACARVGVVLEAAPVDRRGTDQVPLQLRSTRYLAMQRHLDGIGPAGRRMMRCTASTQVCLDWWPGDVGLEQWQVLLLSGPFLAAAFNATGPGSRLETWLAVDPGRTGFDDRLLIGDAVAAYARFADGAVSFTTPGDVDQHLTTLFPPVRPRGRYLEVRYLDVQQERRVATAVTVLTAIVYDHGLRRQLLAELEPERRRLGEVWGAAAAGDVGVARRGRALVERALGVGLVAA